MLAVSGMKMGGAIPYPPVLTTTTLPNGSVGTPYSAQLTAIRGIPPYTFTSGPLGAFTLSASGQITGTPAVAGTFTQNYVVIDSLGVPSAPVSLSITVTAAVSFDFYMSPTGDEILNPNGTLAAPWSLNAFNNASCRALYAGKKIGLLPGNGIYSGFYNNGTFHSLYDTMQATNAWGIFQIQGGTPTASTYVATCDVNGNYSPRSCVIDCANPDTGAYPTQGSTFLGQMLDGSSTSPLPTQLGYVTIDGLHIQHFNYSAIHFGYRTGLLPGIIIQNCWVHDNWGTVRGGNPGAIHLNGTDAVRLINNKIHGLRTAWRQPLPQVVQWQNASGTVLSNSIGATKAVLASPWPYQTVSIDPSLHTGQGFINFSDGSSGNNTLIPPCGMFVNATYGSTLVDWGTNASGTPALVTNVTNTVQFGGINGPYCDSAIMLIGQFEDTRVGNYVIQHNTCYDCGGQVLHLKDHNSTGTVDISYNYFVMGTMGQDLAGYAQTEDRTEGITLAGAAPGATINIHHNLISTSISNIGDSAPGTTPPTILGTRNLGTINCYNNTCSSFETAGDFNRPTGQFNWYDNLVWNMNSNPSIAGVGRWGYSLPNQSIPNYGTRVSNNVYQTGATFYYGLGNGTSSTVTNATISTMQSSQGVEQNSIYQATSPFANGAVPVYNPVDGGLLLSSWAISSAMQTTMLGMPDGVVCGAIDQNGNVVGGGTIGCNFSTAPTGLWLGLSTQGLSFNTTGSGSGSTFQNFIGTDTKYGDTFQLYPASPWGGTATFPDGIQLIYNSVGDIVTTIGTDSTVPYGVSSSVVVQNLVTPFGGTNQQSSYLIHPSITQTQGMFYQSMWFWYQGDMGSRGTDFELEFVEFKTPDGVAGAGGFFGPERFQIQIFQANNSHGFSTSIPNWEFNHNSQITNSSGTTYAFVSGSLAPTSAFTSKGYTAGFPKPYVAVPLGRWAKIEWAFNRSDSQGQGWMWVALTDPGSTDPDLIRGTTIFQARGPFNYTDPDTGQNWTNGMNIPGPFGGVNGPGAFVNRLFLNNMNYGGVGRGGSGGSAGNYVIKWTDVQVYTSWPSNATAHPSNYR